jgi:hypothetical protein
VDLAAGLFLGSRVMRISAIFFSWLTYLYWPIAFHIAYDLQWGRPFKTMIVAVGLLRLFMMFLAVKGMIRAHRRRALSGSPD